MQMLYRSSINSNHRELRLTVYYTLESWSAIYYAHLQEQCKLHTMQYNIVTFLNIVMIDTWHEIILFQEHCLVEFMASTH